ncbi:unnamed protein product [Tenebrio molitor]|nr:unnamed protein product [Tenebrio molitor]
MVCVTCDFNFNFCYNYHSLIIIILIEPLTTLRWRHYLHLNRTQK